MMFYKTLYIAALINYLISLWIVILLSWGQNFLSSNLSVVFLLFFSVVYRETPWDRFSEAGAERHSVHSKVTTILVPFFAIRYEFLFFEWYLD